VTEFAATGSEQGALTLEVEALQQELEALKARRSALAELVERERSLREQARDVASRDWELSAARQELHQHERGLADELELRTVETRTFTLANGVEVARRLAWAGLSFDSRSSPSLVVVGEAGDVPILGAFALEGLGLEVDPVAKTLRPAHQFLLASSIRVPVVGTT